MTRLVWHREPEQTDIGWMSAVVYRDANGWHRVALWDKTGGEFERIDPGRSDGQNALFGSVKEAKEWVEQLILGDDG